MKSSLMYSLSKFYIR